MIPVFFAINTAKLDRRMKLKCEVFYFMFYLFRSRIYIKPTNIAIHGIKMLFTKVSWKVDSVA